MISSTSFRSSSSAFSGATGTARTIFPAPALPIARSAVRTVLPVAIPSSTTMTVLPASGTGGRLPRYPAPLDLLELAPSFARDVVLVYGELGGEDVVDDHLWIGSVHHRTEREFGLPRHPDLADQHDVERGVESLGDLKTDRHAAARQGEHNRFLLPQLLQLRGKLAARRSPIGKHGSTELLFGNLYFWPEQRDGNCCGARATKSCKSRTITTRT